MRIGSVLWCAVLALAGCAHTPPPKDYGKDIAAIRAKLDTLETEVALMKATPAKDDMPMPCDCDGCPADTDCD